MMTISVPIPKHWYDWDYNIDSNDFTLKLTRNARVVRREFGWERLTIDQCDTPSFKFLNSTDAIEFKLTYL